MKRRRGHLLWAFAASLVVTVAHAQLLQIPGEQLERFAPDRLAGRPLVNGMTGSPQGARRLVQPGGVEAVYGLPGGAFANLSIGNTYGRVPYIVESCEEWETFGEHRACVTVSGGRVSLRWVFSAKVMITLAAPDRATAVRLGRGLDLEAIAEFVAETPGTPVGE